MVVSPLDNEVTPGVTAIEASAFAVTVKVAVLELTPLNEAEMVLMPGVKVEAMPVAFNVATAVLLETQVTEPETLPVVPSE